MAGSVGGSPGESVAGSLQDSVGGSSGGSFRGSLRGPLGGSSPGQRIGPGVEQVNLRLFGSLRYG